MAIKLEGIKTRKPTVAQRKAIKAFMERDTSPPKEIDDTGTFKTNAKCVVSGCAGEIIKESKRELLDPNPGNVRMGGHNATKLVSKFYCDVCQVMYNNIPR